MMGREDKEGGREGGRTFMAVHAYYHPRNSTESNPTESRAVVEEDVEVKIPLQEDETNACGGGREGGREGGGGRSKRGVRDTWMKRMTRQRCRGREGRRKGWKVEESHRR